MTFPYNEQYFKKHYSFPLYQHYLNLRNKFIFEETLPLISSGDFLEIGFGNDSLIKFFKKDFNVFGVDISKIAVKKIREKFNPAHFKVCNISKEIIPFKHKFITICAINVIEHLEKPKFALKNIFNSLKRGGVFVIYLPTQNNLFSKVQYRIFYDVKEHLFRPSINSLNDLLKDSGFIKWKEFAASFIPLKLSSKLILESFNLYLGLWRRIN